MASRVRTATAEKWEENVKTNNLLIQQKVDSFRTSNLDDFSNSTRNRALTVEDAHTKLTTESPDTEKHRKRVEEMRERRKKSYILAFQSRGLSVKEVRERFASEVDGEAERTRRASQLQDLNLGEQDESLEDNDLLEVQQLFGGDEGEAENLPDVNDAVYSDTDSEGEQEAPPELSTTIPPPPPPPASDSEASEPQVLNFGPPPPPHFDGETERSSKLPEPQRQEERQEEPPATKVENNEYSYNSGGGDQEKPQSNYIIKEGHATAVGREAVQLEFGDEHGLEQPLLLVDDIDDDGYYDGGVQEQPTRNKRQQSFCERIWSDVGDLCG